MIEKFCNIINDATGWKPPPTPNPFKSSTVSCRLRRNHLQQHFLQRCRVRLRAGGVECDATPGAFTWRFQPTPLLVEDGAGPRVADALLLTPLPPPHLLVVCLSFVPDVFRPPRTLSPSPPQISFAFLGDMSFSAAGWSKISSNRTKSVNL